MMKSWNPGDSRVEKYMPEVSKAIKRHLKWPSGEFTDIYNRCYEAVWRVITDYENKPIDNANNVKYWIEGLQEEVHNAFHEYRRENNLEVEFKINGIIYNTIFAKAKMIIYKRMEEK